MSNFDITLLVGALPIFIVLLTLLTIIMVSAWKENNWVEDHYALYILGIPFSLIMAWLCCYALSYIIVLTAISYLGA